MRALSMLILLFLSSKLLAQDVYKERLVSWVTTTSFPFDIPGCFYDSTVVHYPNRNTPPDIHIENIYVVYPVYPWRSKFDSISYYSCDKGETTLDYTHYTMSNSELGQYESLSLYPTRDTLSYEKIRFDKRNNRQLQREHWYDFGLYGPKSHFIKASYSRTKWLDSKSYIDSTVNYSLRDTFIRKTEKYHFNKNFEVTKTTDFRGSPSANPDICIDTSLAGYSSTEMFTLVNGLKTNHTIERRKDKTNIGTSLLVLLSYNGQSWDTTQYIERQEIDSFYNGNLVQQITMNRNAPADSFQVFAIVHRTYDGSLLKEMKNFVVDSSNQLYHNQTVTLGYNNQNKLIYQKVLNEQSGAAIESKWTYTALGNPASRTLINSESLQEGRTTFYRYFYEPYLQEKTNLNYAQLVPISYPNPFDQNTMILFSCVPNKKGTIRIFNANGKLLEQYDFSSSFDTYQYYWNATEYKSGFYFAQITMGKEIATVRLIKQ